MPQDSTHTGNTVRADVPSQKRALILLALAAWLPCALLAGCRGSWSVSKSEGGQHSAETTERESEPIDPSTSRGTAAAQKTTPRRLSERRNRTASIKTRIGIDDRVKLVQQQGKHVFLTPDDKPPLRNYDKFKSLLEAVGQLVGHKSCTATHMGEGTFVSAGHCFKLTPDEAQEKKKRNCKSYSVTIAVNKTTASYQCSSVLAIEDEAPNGIDYAIFEVFDTGNPPINAIPTAPISSLGVPQKPKNLLMASFYTGTPWLSGLCSSGKPIDKTIPHDCDGDEGASGSLIFDVTSGNNRRYVATALHMRYCVTGVEEGEGYGNCAMSLAKPPLKEHLSRFMDRQP
jgi:hypothetical protein